MPLAELFVEPLQEGVRDKNILKAVFLAGAGGAGKGAVADAMFAGWGMKTINQDRHLERFLKDAKVPLSDAGSRYDLLKKAQKLKGMELRQYAQRRLGLVVDSTGWDFKRIGDPAKKLRELGYDIYMIFVNTSLKTALRRNKARGKKGGRKVPDAYIETAWHGSQKNLSRFRTLFGKKNMFIVDNDVDLPKRTWTSVIVPALRKLGDKIAQRPIRNPAGKKWLAKQAATPDIDDPTKPSEWPAPPEPEPVEIGQYDMLSLWKGSKTPPGGSKHPKAGASKPVAARKGASVRHKGVAAPKLSGAGSVALKQGGATITFGKGLIDRIFGGKKKKTKKPAQESLHESPMAYGGESTNAHTDTVGGGGDGLVLEDSSGAASLTTLFQTRSVVRHGTRQGAAHSREDRRLSGGVAIDIESIEEKHWRDNPKDFRSKLQIEPEKVAKSHSVASIGKSAKDGKYYGWSHRAYKGFKVGDRKFVTVDWSQPKATEPGGEHPTWDELEAQEKELQAKAPRIKNDGEAKQSAIAYADSVS